MTSKVGETRICQICGQEFQTKPGGWNRKYCYDCSPSVNKHKKEDFAKNINRKRKAIKLALIQENGGKCCRCGYNKSTRALSFHHLDPSQKDFNISRQINRNLNDLREEVKKCILVCMNCHAEIHEELEQQGYIQFENELEFE